MLSQVTICPWKTGTALKPQVRKIQNVPSVEVGTPPTAVIKENVFFETHMVLWFCCSVDCEPVLSTAWDTGKWCLKESISYALLAALQTCLYIAWAQPGRSKRRSVNSIPRSYQLYGSCDVPNTFLWNDCAMIVLIKILKWACSPFTVMDSFIQIQILSFKLWSVTI